MAKITQKSVRVPQNLNECADAVAEIALTQIGIDELNASFDRELEDLKARRKAALVDLATSCADQAKAIAAFAEANRDRLTDGERCKTVDLGDNRAIRWYLHPVATKVITSDEDVITALEAGGLDEYVITEKRLDRERLIADRDMLSVPGLKFVQGETFAIVTGRSSDITRNRTIKL